MERAGLTDPDGDIAAQFQQQPVLYIPSVVAIEQIEETFQISYKVPKRVWKKTPYPHLDLDALCASGWTVKEQTQGLIPDLLRLAESDRNAVVGIHSRCVPLWACSRHPSCRVTDINARLPALKVHCR